MFLIIYCQSESWGAPPGRPKDCDRGKSDHTRDSTQQQFFPISLRHHSDITNDRNIDLLGRDSDSNSSWQGEYSDRQTISPSEFFGSAWGHPPMTHFDMCIELIMFSLCGYCAGVNYIILMVSPDKKIDLLFCIL